MRDVLETILGAFLKPLFVLMDGLRRLLLPYLVPLLVIELTVLLVVLLLLIYEG